MTQQSPRGHSRLQEKVSISLEWIQIGCTKSVLEHLFGKTIRNRIIFFNCDCMEPQSPLEDPSGSMRPSATPRARELRVEDALRYLDQVKLEFHDKPHIYNEFLEIMKNFKAQSINTPGVIDRVKNLFRGYPNLILGFNTFLPEGEGFKIELTPEEQDVGVSIPRQPVGSHVMDYPGPERSDMVGPYGQPYVDRPMMNGPPLSHIQNTGIPNISSTPAHIGTPTNIPQSMQPQIKPQQMQQQHAVKYVTDIRNRFVNEPETYKAFLRILHTYQKEQKGITDVLEQVSQLFADHPDLLMEFSYFLPDSVQEKAKERLQLAVKEAEARRKNIPSSISSGSNIMYPHTMNANINIPMSGAGGPMGPNKKRRWGEGGRGGPAGPPGEGSGGRGRGGGPSMRKLQANRRAVPANANEANMNSNMTQVDMADDGRTTTSMINVSASSQFRNMAVMPSDQIKMEKPLNQGRSTIPSATASANISPMGGGSSTGPGGVSAVSTPAQNKLPSGLQSRQSYSHLAATGERRFFDQVKEILTQTSREAWHEFVKCLDLFSTGALSKQDMLALVKDLFGGMAGNELFDEFKRLLSVRADYEARGSDMWYAVPLSEVDFSQCRKCTPSYRALPKDFPAPVCSERSSDEATYLNDEWVSIPIGSEESYSFKHMRKNQYEEALFKCEDERFEIDMIIDSNISTIRILEPIEQEINQILAMEDTDTLHPGISLSPKFNFQLEKRGLSTIHLNAITRLYGEHGSEILDLLRKNPVGTIPVVLKRLKQKDTEWRKSRVELNRQWREVMAKNYEKSFDHRSFYFKQQDKRITNHRQFVLEIKNILDTPYPPGSTTTAVSSSLSPPTSTDNMIMNSPNANLTTSTSNHAGSQSISDDLKQPELYRTIASEYQSLLSSMTPHLVMRYNIKQYHTIHRDIYRIITHAAEHTISSVFEKERIASLWRDMLRVFFNIPLDFLYPASNPALTEKPGPGRADKWNVWLTGTRVITTFGSGKILDYRVEDNFYQVQLVYGIGYIRSSAILGAEELSAQALNVIGVQHNEVTKTDTIFEGNITSTSTPQNTVSDPCKLFYGTQMSYIFFRLHHILYTRLCLARQLALNESENVKTSHPLAYLDEVSDDENDKMNVDSYDHTMEGHTPTVKSRSTNAHGNTSNTSKTNHYNVYLGQLYALLNGTIDNVKYEEMCRQLLGNRAFVLYTLDKVIIQALKCLQAMANDDVVNKLIGVFVYHRSRAVNPFMTPNTSQTTTTTTNNGGVDSELYLNHVGAIVSQTMEDIYRLQLLVTNDLTVTSADLSCQFIGVIHNQTPGASTGSTDMKAPQLVLQEEEDDDDMDVGGIGGIGGSNSSSNTTTVNGNHDSATSVNHSTNATNGVLSNTNTNTNTNTTTTTTTTIKVESNVSLSGLFNNENGNNLNNHPDSHSFTSTSHTSPRHQAYSSASSYMDGDGSSGSQDMEVSGNLSQDNNNEDDDDDEEDDEDDDDDN